MWAAYVDLFTVTSHGFIGRTYLVERGLVGWRGRVAREKMVAAQERGGEGGRGEENQVHGFHRKNTSIAGPSNVFCSELRLHACSRVTHMCREKIIQIMKSSG